MLVNGNQLAFTPGLTVQALLENQGLDAARVAVERNGEIVRRADFSQTLLADSDTIEIVHFVGGG